MCLLFICEYREESQDLPASTSAVKDALRSHMNQVMSSDMENTQLINVLRSQVFRNAIYAFGRPSFDTTKYLKVRFNGEPAIDQGGPRHEFFRLFCLQWVKLLACFMVGLIIYHQFQILKLWPPKNFTCGKIIYFNDCSRWSIT